MAQQVVPAERRLPKRRDEFLVDDLDDLLARGEALRDVGADRPRSHPGQEVLTTPTLTSASSSARRTSRSAASTSASDEPAFAAQPREDVTKLLGDRVEHQAALYGPYAKERPLVGRSF